MWVELGSRRRRGREERREPGLCFREEKGNSGVHVIRRWKREGRRGEEYNLASHLGTKNINK
jgi:hypothetical protein